MIHANVTTFFSSQTQNPDIHPTAFVHPLAAAVGRVQLGKRVFVAPFASVRGDEGAPIFVGDEANVQDGVIFHSLETEKDGSPVESNLVEVDGARYSIYVGPRVSLAHQAQIHGPAAVGEGTFVGMKALVFRARVGAGCVLEPACIVMGVEVADGRIVPTGAVISTQEQADALEQVTPDYHLAELNDGVVRVNATLAEGYHRAGLAARAWPNVHENVAAGFSSKVTMPDIDPTAYIHPLAAAIGRVRLGRRVFVAPLAAVRGDEGAPIHVGDEANIQECVVLHALETEEDGKPVEANLVEVDGGKYSIYVGNRVSVGQQAQIHGPASVGDGTFVGMKSLVFKSRIGKGCVLEPGCIVTGVRVPDGKIVPAGAVVATREAAEALAEVTPDYPLAGLNEEEVHVNTALADGYHRAGLAARAWAHIHANVAADFASSVAMPEIDATAYVHPLSAAIGRVRVGQRVFVAPFASIRGDEGTPIHVSRESNVQEGVILHALGTEKHGSPVDSNLIEVDGERYSIHVGRRVSLAQQSHIHGPAAVGEGTFVGMKALVFKARVGKGCVLEPGCIVMGVEIADRRVVPVGAVISTQQQADALAEVTPDHPFANLNEEEVQVNTALADAYRQQWG